MSKYHGWGVKIKPKLGRSFLAGIYWSYGDRGFDNLTVNPDPVLRTRTFATRQMARDWSREDEIHSSYRRKIVKVTVEVTEGWI